MHAISSCRANKGRLSDGGGTMTTRVIDRYRWEAGRHPPLGPAETLALATRCAQTQDPALIQRFATANLRLVMFIVRDFLRPGLDELDLIQSGNEGLLRAIKHFDPSRGVSFAFYAGFWIRKHMLQCVAAARKHQVAGLQEPEEIASDDSKFRDESTQHQLCLQLRDAVRAFEPTLTPQELQIFRARWLTSEPAKLSALGQCLKLPRHQVSQIERRILSRLRQVLGEELGDVMCS